MPQQIQIYGNEPIIELGDGALSLKAPGLVGTLSYQQSSPSNTDDSRSFLATDPLSQALEEAHLQERHRLVIEASHQSTADSGRGAFIQTPDENIQLTASSALDEFQFAIYTDEAGDISFHYPKAIAATDGGRSFSVNKHWQYEIPVREARTPEQNGTASRGWISAIASKLIKIVVGKVLAPYTGELAHWAVELWERSQRPHLGLCGGNNFSELLNDPPQPFTEFGPLLNQPALLFLHGTTSSVANCFKGLSLAENSAIPAKLYEQYQGRVLGFNHHTLSTSIAENVRQFYQAFAGQPGDYTFDIITHSRGGLLGRAITHLPDEYLAKHLNGWTRPKDIRICINRAVFVAAPNAGTDLARPGNLPDFVERLANYVNQLPDGLLSISFGALLSLASAIAEAGLPYVPGLEDQGPESEFLQALNDGKAQINEYYAIEADYHVIDSLSHILQCGVMAAGKQVLADRLFGQKPNDVVVPSDGVSDTPRFKLDDSHVFRFDGHIAHHTNLFSQPDIRKILDFLQN